MRRKRRIFGAAAAMALLAAWSLLEEAGAYSLDTIIVGPENSSVSDGENTKNQSGQPEEEHWKLTVVNRWNPIPDSWEVTLTQLQNDQSVDSRIYPELQQMFDDARAEGILPLISSSYRTGEMQQEMMDEKIQEYLDQGYTYQEAEEQAEWWVAVPGTSEHQLGLAVDITTADWQRQDASVVWQWLNENSCRYGFIRRYPEDKSDITGISGEPWHYRYVGKKAAEEITRQGICLEEYLGE